ncbi:fungal specific transcription factor domain-containing protein [Venturia nashicola]|uniref:Fungal specific transcription factor domain-containing protein n=1 Tax=Venturia nashicola TaxID=86259 RepID=A0A4Z1PHR0_9PEZI|nr:fungal specific transcription factor domain-containing protein [Venturia nashicola]
MADRNSLSPGGQRSLLPSPNPRTTSDELIQANSPDGFDGTEGAQSKAGGKSMKRAKVTAVACQPCQKRKSKCDGQRPTCSACNTKSTESECHYDSAGDQRRTSALKDRIDAGERESQDLKMIIDAMCTDPSTIDLVRDRLVFEHFSRTHQMANVFRARMASGAALGYDEYTGFQEPPYSQPSFLDDDTAPSPTATHWSSDILSGEEEEADDFEFEEETYRDPGPHSWR